MVACIDLAGIAQSYGLPPGSSVAIIRGTTAAAAATTADFQTVQSDVFGDGGAEFPLNFAGLPNTHGRPPRPVPGQATLCRGCFQQWPRNDEWSRGCPSCCCSCVCVCAFTRRLCRHFFTTQVCIIIIIIIIILIIFKNISP